MADQLPVFSTQKYEIPADSHNFLVPSENSAFGIPVPCLQFKIAFKKIPTLRILKTTPICRKKKNKDSIFPYPYYPIIFDPQTSGGLLASVPSKHANDCINQLQSIGYKDSCVVAYVIPSIRGEGFIKISCS